MAISGGEGELEEARGLLEKIAATPRASGSDEEREAREFCARRLREHGFSLREEPFLYSAFAGRVATPLAGALLLSFFAAVPHAASRGEHLLAAAVAVGHFILLGAVFMLSTGNSVLRLPLLRRAGVNLVAWRGADEPRVWLMAHLDSKSQPVSILLRFAAVTAVIVLLLATIPLVAVGFLGWHAPFPVWIGLAVAGSASSIPLLLSLVANRSRGALDNASGVTAALLAAGWLARDGRSGLGVVLTSAEELGLAGAHAWSAERVPGIALNCDSVDDDGLFLCMTGWRQTGAAAAALSAAAAESETRLVMRRKLTGILVDSMALTTRGWDAVTLCRGKLASLRRIHTPHDVPGAIRGGGIVAAALLLKGAAITLVEQR